MNAPSRHCAAPGCGKVLTGRSDKLYCDDTCGKRAKRSVAESPKLIAAFDRDDLEERLIALGKLDPNHTDDQGKVLEALMKALGLKRR